MDRCLWCENPATRLCDGTVGWTACNDLGQIGTGSEHFTCDAPMCDLHAHKVGHICGTKRMSNPGLNEPSAIRWGDTIDHCPSCHDDPLPRGVVMTAEEAESIRRRRRAPVVRLRMRSISTAPRQDAPEPQRPAHAQLELPSLADLSAPARSAAMRGGMAGWGQVGGLPHHIRYVEPLPKRPGRKPKCHCGCNGPKTHRGMANGVCLTSGCELAMRRWQREGEGRS